MGVDAGDVNGDGFDDLITGAFGYDADIVILGDDYDPLKTMIGGEIVYER